MKGVQNWVPRAKRQLCPDKLDIFSQERGTRNMPEARRLRLSATSGCFPTPRTTGTVSQPGLCLCTALGRSVREPPARYTELSVKWGPITVTSQDDDRWNSKSDKKGMKQELHVGFCNLLTKVPPTAQRATAPPKGAPSGLTSSQHLQGGKKNGTILKA